MAKALPHSPGPTTAALFVCVLCLFADFLNAFAGNRDVNVNESKTTRLDDILRSFPILLIIFLYDTKGLPNNIS